MADTVTLPARQLFDLAADLRRATLVDRFWPKVDKAGPLPKWAPFLGPCWLWTATTNTGGYGKFWDTRTMVPAHRFSYERHVGPVPDGMVIDHICRVPACVRPDHLEPVSPRENTLRGFGPTARNATKTHCPKGHEYTEENTYWRPSGRRRCRACNRESRQAERRAARLSAEVAC